MWRKIGSLVNRNLAKVINYFGDLTGLGSGSLNNVKSTDVLRVTEFVLEKSESRTPFSVLEAARSQCLNGIDDYRIAEILRTICLDPNGPGTLETHTTIDNQYRHNVAGNWTLTADAYFGYLSYQAILQTKKSNNIAIYALIVAVLSLVATAIF